MADRVVEVLYAHLRLARRQLELMSYGVDFSQLDSEGDGITIIPTTEQDLLTRIAKLEIAIAKHEDRSERA